MNSLSCKIIKNKYFNFFFFFFSRETNRPRWENGPTFKSKRFSQPLGTCKSRSSSWVSFTILEEDPLPPRRSRVIRAVDFSELESVLIVPCWSSLYLLITRTRELTSAAIFRGLHRAFLLILSSSSFF